MTDIGIVRTLIVELRWECDYGFFMHPLVTAVICALLTRVLSGWVGKMIVGQPFIVLY